MARNNIENSKLKVSYVIVLLFILFSCGNGPKSAVDEASIYSDIFAAFAEHDYFDMCWQEELTILRSKYLSIDSVGEVQFKFKYDSLKRIAESSVEKCVIFQKRTFDDDIAQYFDFDRLSPDSFYDGRFEKFARDEMIKRLTTPSSISPTFDGKFLGLRHPESNDLAMGSGTIGSFAFSECLISDQNDRAILYYELDCGINCGEGVMVLVELKDEQWMIKKTIPIWDR